VTAHAALAGLRTAVLALGDLGRSPRATYHVEALARHGAQVAFVGYRGTPLPEALRCHPRVHVAEFDPPSRRHTDRLGLAATRLGYLAAALVDTVSLSGRTTHELNRGGPFDLLIVQTPPAVPSLALAQYVARRDGARLIIDWHNFTHSLIALDRRAVAATACTVAGYERLLSRTAHHHLCVSNAMRDVLHQWGASNVTTFHDQPSHSFRPLAEPERQIERARLLDELGFRGEVGRARLVVSSTSYTKDERLDWLLDALVEARRSVQTDPESAAPVCVVVTGKGAGSEEFRAQLRSLQSRIEPTFQVLTAWLNLSDYAALLGCADLGLSLHKSASGVDIPMKLLDMIGAALPIAALDYSPCLWERLDSDCGLTFGGPDELAGLLHQCFFAPAGAARLAEMRRRLRQSPLASWTEHWSEIVLPVVARLAATLEC